MILNLPSFEPRTLIKNGKNVIFDPLRKRYIRLTPEEYVRQYFVNFLINYRHFPQSLLANEVAITLGNVKKRCDTVVYDKYLSPLALVEYKAPSVEISQETFNQILSYNMKFRVPWLIVSNGLNHYCCKINFSDGSYSFEKDIPDYNHISNAEINPMS